MESKAKRTLVKSAPELWELADDIAQMESWMGGFVGSSDPVRIEVTDRVPGEILAWRSTSETSNARIAVSLAESGFGTSVQITANHESDSPAACDALERLLDELGSPDRRPFAAD